MAKIISNKANEEISLPKGSEISNACKKLGVSFNCKNGVCGTCMINIKEGKENLSKLTKQEHNLARNKEHRLACQCKIKKGTVKIDF
jgi:ferredoxin|tara:strand:- start:299 stop:559 length:261 start_codon:yes stop_codon:yes gene_type:complete